MSTLAVGASISLALQGSEIFTITSQPNTIFRATFTAVANLSPLSGGGRSYGPQAQALTLGPFGVPGTLVLENQQSTAGSTLTYTRSLGYVPAYVLSQTAVPVMIPQTSLVTTQGQMYLGTSISTSVDLTAPSGSVTITLGGAYFAGTSADVGKQITFYDVNDAKYRSALITAFGTTSTATALLASTASDITHTSTVLLGYALPTNYTPGVWVYLPAGAVVGGAAGFYWCTPFGTTDLNGALQVTTAYQATMTVPSIPTGYSNARGGNTYYSAPLTAQTLRSATVPGGSMGSNGAIRTTARWAFANTTNSKTTTHALGGAAFGQNTNASTLSFVEQQSVFNRGVQTNQLGGWNGYQASFNGSSAASFLNISVNTANDLAATVTGSLANAADYMVLEACSIEVMPNF